MKSLSLLVSLALASVSLMAHAETKERLYLTKQNRDKPASVKASKQGKSDYEMKSEVGRQDKLARDKFWADSKTKSSGRKTQDSTIKK